MRLESQRVTSNIYVLHGRKLLDVLVTCFMTHSVILSFFMEGNDFHALYFVEDFIYLHVVVYLELLHV